LPDERITVFAWHSDVCKQDVYVLALKHAEGLWRRTRAEDGGTRTLEENRHQFAALWIIVSHKNGDAFERATDIRWLFSATLCGRLTLVSVCSNYRELHGKRRALSLAGAARGHRSTVSFDKVLHDSRPQTEAAICPRRRSVRLTERFEHQSSGGAACRRAVLLTYRAVDV
jgi:hypothetical protein